MEMLLTPKFKIVESYQKSFEESLTLGVTFHLTGLWGMQSPCKYTSIR